MTYYYVRDEQNNIREDVIKLAQGDFILYIPNADDNTYWQAYQAWLAADPENNIPLEEGV